MNNRNKKPQGFIVIISLLIVTTVAMFFAMSMLLDGITNASLSLNSIYYEDAYINMNTCLEDVLYRVRQEEEFTRNINYTISEGNSCSTNIVWFEETPVAQGITERLINLDVTGISNGFVRTFQYELKATKYDVNHSDGSLDYMNTVSFISINEMTS